MKTLRLLAAGFAALAFAALPLIARAQISVGISIRTAPPPIPVYAVPPPPAPNYVWEPGYWAWGPGGYYWVPGTWVYAPQPGLYWTPGYWNWNGTGFVFIAGYWGPRVGYYGGINYGGGYWGNGYVGGYWHNRTFVYNTFVVNVNRTVVGGNVYYRPYPRPTRYVSYVGGRGGLHTRPTAQQTAYMHEHHWAPTAVQVQHARIAAQNRAYYANVNHGRPSSAAVARPYTAASHPAFHAPAAAPHPAYHAPAPARPTYHAPAAAHPTYHAPVQHAAPAHHAPPQGHSGGGDHHQQQR